MSERLNNQLIRLTLLLQLERRARQATANELPYVLVNETSELIPYRQAVLWRTDKSTLEAASGVAKPEPNSPYALWLKPVLNHLSRNENANQIKSFSVEDLPKDLAAEWVDWLPEHGLWMPIRTAFGSRYVLTLFREASWSEAEIHLLSYLIEAYGHAYSLTEAAKPAISFLERLKTRKNQLTLAAIVLVALFFPIRQSVLAEAEVVAYKPNLVRSPLEGVVDAFYVQPNEVVKVGQKIFSLDKAELKSRLEVAKEKRDSAQTEYLQTTQEAMLDPKVKFKLAGLKSKWEQEAAEVDYVSTLLKRCDVNATIAGVTVFDDPNEWLGKPVKQGEKILAVANPDSVELEVRLPMEDLIVLAPGDEVLFFSNIAPHKPLEAALNYFSYRASPTPSDVMAYRLKAAFTERAELPRLGFHGTAKLYGARKPFILWLLRKPIRTIRLWLTL
ncbi:MAG: HlyD family efflux transporter periplasmic adaptor subunit [Methylococcaceae bacterium]|nr:HlyD family efflux transporter periplasmic adaptor subunit [Methylococcaceae bacterium]